MTEQHKMGRPRKKMPQPSLKMFREIEIEADETPSLGDEPPPLASSEAPDWNQLGDLLKAVVGRLDAQDKRLEALSKRPAARRERPSSRGAAMTDSGEVITDRDGNIVTRRAIRSLDPFELPEEFVMAQQADDYTAEWKSYRVLNQDMDAYLNDLYNDGWVPVKNNRIPGRYGGELDDAVVHQGMMLMERPAGLTRMARREQEMASREQVNSRKRDWGVDESRKRVFDPEGRFNENLNRIRSTVEQVPAGSYPQHEIASADEL
jgi:hypothetical protein